jgi:hypothetical protein
VASLSKETIQRLAVLRAVSMWASGAYGPVRVHKTLFFADKTAGDKEWHLFTFKKWQLGQYSDEIADGLNALRAAGCIDTVYDGPSERIIATVSSKTETKIKQLFRDFFPVWHKALTPAFKEWAYLTADDVIKKAHEDASYTKRQHGEVIVESFDWEVVSFTGLSDEDAESLNDTVDPRFQRGLSDRTEAACRKTLTGGDWRHIYFGDQKQAV